MASAADSDASEMALVDKVLFKLATADTDEALETTLCKFLPSCLLKLSSSQEGVRKKVLELLVHVNKRAKGNERIQLPVDALLLQYQVSSKVQSEVEIQ